MTGERERRKKRKINDNKEETMIISFYRIQIIQRIILMYFFSIKETSFKANNNRNNNLYLSVI